MFFITSCLRSNYLEVNVIMSYPEKVVQLLKENKLEEAVKVLLEAIEAEPDVSIHYVNMGTLLLQQKQYEEAERFLLQAIQLDEKAATAYFGLANLYYETEKYDIAENALKMCLTLKLEDSDVYYLLGMIYVKRNKPLFALPYLLRATELKEQVHYLFQYGLALAETNHLNEAEEIFQRTLQIDEQHEDALYNLAIIKIHKDCYKEALDLLNKVIQINANHQLAKNALAQLNKFH